MLVILYVFLIVNQMQIIILNFYIHSIVTLDLHLKNKLINKFYFSSRSLMMETSFALLFSAKKL